MPSIRQRIKKLANTINKSGVVVGTCPRPDYGNEEVTVSVNSRIHPCMGKFVSTGMGVGKWQTCPHYKGAETSYSDVLTGDFAKDVKTLVPKCSLKKF